MSYSKSSKIFGDYAPNTTKPDNSDPTVRQFCLTSLPKHSDLTVICIGRIAMLSFGRRCEMLNSVSDHNGMIEVQTSTIRKPDVGLNRAPAEHQSAYWHSARYLQQCGITEFVRVEINRAKTNFRVASVIVNC